MNEIKAPLLEGFLLTKIRCLTKRIVRESRPQLLIRLLIIISLLAASVFYLPIATSVRAQSSQSNSRISEDLRQMLSSLSRAQFPSLDLAQHHCRAGQDGHEKRNDCFRQTHGMLPLTDRLAKN